MTNNVWWKCNNYIDDNTFCFAYHHVSGTSILRPLDSSSPKNFWCWHILPPNWSSVRSRLNEIRTWESRPVPSNIGRKLWRVRDWRGDPQWHYSCCRCCKQHCHKLCNGVFFLHPSIHTTRNIHVRIIFCCVCTTCILINLKCSFKYTKSFRTYRAMIHVFVEHPSHIPVLAGIYGFDEYSSYFSFFANNSQFLFCYGTYTRLCK